MAVFRKHTPKRQEITINVLSYHEHKEDLQKDFQNRCGYCNDIKWGNAEFEIDHFVPQKPKNFKTTIGPTLYFNLVYACKSCNRAKGNKWVTNNENTANINDIGFIDPCDKEYNNQFERTETGRIVHKTALGEWMYKALKLHKPQHEIIWNIDLTNKLIDEIEKVLNYKPNEELSRKLLSIYKKFRNYTKQLGNIG